MRHRRETSPTVLLCFLCVCVCVCVCVSLYSKRPCSFAFDQHLLVSLTQDEHKDWKVSVEMPGAMKVLEQMTELHPIRDKMKEVIGENVKFGIAIAGKGKMEILGISLKDLYQRLGVADKIGMAIGKAVDMVDKAKGAAFDSMGAGAFDPEKEAIAFVEKGVKAYDDGVSFVYNTVARIEHAANTKVNEGLALVRTNTLDRLLGLTAEIRAAAKEGIERQRELTTQSVAVVTNILGEVRYTVDDLGTMVTDTLEEVLEKPREYLTMARTGAETYLKFLRYVPLEVLNKPPFNLDPAGLAMSHVQRAEKEFNAGVAKVKALVKAVDEEAKKKVAEITATLKANTLDKVIALTAAARKEGKVPTERLFAEIDEVAEEGAALTAMVRSTIAKKLEQPRAEIRKIRQGLGMYKTLVGGVASTVLASSGIKVDPKALALRVLGEASDAVAGAKADALGAVDHMKQYISDKMSIALAAVEARTVTPLKAATAKVRSLKSGKVAELEKKAVVVKNMLNSMAAEAGALGDMAKQLLTKYSAETQALVATVSGGVKQVRDFQDKLPAEIKGKAPFNTDLGSVAAKADAAAALVAGLVAKVEHATKAGEDAVKKGVAAAVAAVNAVVKAAKGAGHVADAKLNELDAAADSAFAKLVAVRDAVEAKIASTIATVTRKVGNEVAKPIKGVIAAATKWVNAQDVAALTKQLDAYMLSKLDGVGLGAKNVDKAIAKVDEVSALITLAEKTVGRVTSMIDARAAVLVAKAKKEISKIVAKGEGGVGNVCDKIDAKAKELFAAVVAKFKLVTDFVSSKTALATSLVDKYIVAPVQPLVTKVKGWLKKLDPKVLLEQLHSFVVARLEASGLGPKNVVKVIGYIDQARGVLDTITRRVESAVAMVKDIVTKATNYALDKIKLYVDKFLAAGDKIEQALAKALARVDAEAKAVYDKLVEKIDIVLAVVREKKDLVMGLFKKHVIDRVQPVMDVTVEWLNKIKAAGGLKEILKNMLEDEALKRIEKSMRNRWFMRPSIMEVYKSGFVPEDLSSVCPKKPGKKTFLLL